MGYPDEALKRAARAVDLANALRHSFSMGVAYGFRATVHHFRGEFDDARVWAERAIEVCEEAGFVVWLAHARVMHGRVLAELGDPLRGVEAMRLGYELWAETGAVVTQPFYLTMQSEGLLLAGEHNKALDVVDRALQLVEAHGERYYEAEIRRLRGEVVARLAQPGAARKLADAETSLLNALQIAKRQRLGSLELRAALSLAQLPGETRPAAGTAQALKEALGKVHGGETTLDVRRAKAVLQELQRGHRAYNAESTKTV
jgi:predicted ATPase